MARSATATSAAPSNFRFFGGREDDAFVGVQAQILADLALKQPVPAVVLGRLFRGGLAKGSTAIPVDPKDRPRFNGAGKIIFGSVEKAGAEDAQRDMIVSHRDEQNWYVLVRTGLRVDQEGIMGDLLQLIGSGAQLTTHGVFSFHKGSGAEKIAESRTEKADLGKVASEKLFDAGTKRKIPMLKCPENSYSLWRVPVDGVLLVRDINGKMSRLVGGRTQLQVVDADGCAPFFELLYEANQKLLQKQNTARN